VRDFRSRIENEKELIGLLSIELSSAPTERGACLIANGRECCQGHEDLSISPQLGGNGNRLPRRGAGRPQ